MNLRSLIDERAEKQASNSFILDAATKRTYTYAQTRSIVSAIADGIRERGIEPGESVAFAMNNSAACALTVLGIMYGGYRATAINLVSGSRTIAYVLEHSEARLILTEPAQHTLLNEIFSLRKSDAPLLTELPVWDLDDTAIDAFLEALSKQPDRQQPDVQQSVEIAPVDDALLMYTSGTTGTPKGVQLSHSNLLGGGNNTCLAHELTSADRAMCVLPLYHINGLVVTLMGPLVSCGSVVIPGKFSASAFWTTIDAFSCTWFSVVPTQISYLLHAEPKTTDAAAGHKSLRFGRSASAPLSPEVQQSFEDRFGVAIVETMGLTETAAPILSNPLPPQVRKIGSPGVAFGCEVIIVDAQLSEVSPGMEGEILVRGDNVMKGYYKNPDASSDALTPTGWLRTGDLGKKDDDGYVFVTGRLKELIIKGGENIAPREIDEALYRHPSVIEAAAFACPCDNYGQRVEAAVSVDAASELDESILLEFCQDFLGKFKTPDRIYFLDELPKGPSGKIQRRRLVELFASG